MDFQSSLGAYAVSTYPCEHDMLCVINGITVYAKIRAQLAVWARTLTLSPMTNPMVLVMISESRVLIFASQCLALGQTQLILFFFFVVKTHSAMSDTVQLA